MMFIASSIPTEQSAGPLSPLAQRQAAVPSCCRMSDKLATLPPGATSSDQPLLDWPRAPGDGARGTFQTRAFGWQQLALWDDASA
jgi:hypothetical protein